MLTNKRYTIILSAEHASNSAAANAANTESLKRYIEVALKEVVYTAIGHYKGERENSLIIHTDSYPLIRHMAMHVFNFYAQEAVLISSNSDADINLKFADNSPAFPLGSHFATGKGDGENYTTLNGIDWSVSA